MFFIYIITSFYFLMLFLDISYFSSNPGHSWSFSESVNGVPSAIQYPSIPTCHIRPLDTDCRVIPCQAALVVRMPEVIDFVTELCLVRQDQEAMRKAFRNQELFFVFFRQFHTIPFSIGCGTRRSTATSNTLPRTARTSLHCG